MYEFKKYLKETHFEPLRKKLYSKNMQFGTDRHLPIGYIQIGHFLKKVNLLSVVLRREFILQFKQYYLKMFFII